MSQAGWHLFPSPAASRRHRFFATLRVTIPSQIVSWGCWRGKPRLFHPAGEDATAHWPEVRWCLDGR
jgi:hypothetical protein